MDKKELELILQQGEPLFIESKAFFHKIMHKVYISVMDNIILKWIITSKLLIIWEKIIVGNILCMN